MLAYKEKIAEIVSKLWKGAKTIFSQIVFEQLFKDTIIEIDSKDDLIKIHNKTAKIECDVGYNDAKGYSVGKALWALREFLFLSRIIWGNKKTSRFNHSDNLQID